VINLTDQERERFIAYLQQEVGETENQIISARIAGYRIRLDTQITESYAMKVVMKKLRHRPMVQLQSNPSLIVLRP
jgi:hypothetical protein